MGERNLMADEDDHKRTIQYGESAISYIKKNVLPAYPRSTSFGTLTRLDTIKA